VLPCCLRRHAICNASLNAVYGLGNGLEMERKTTEK
jgi:hypothetical protein